MTTPVTTSATATDREHDGVAADDMGPIDFIAIEFPHRQTPGEGLPIFLDLVDRGIIRILDLVFIRKDSDTSVQRLELRHLSPELAVFEGATSGLLDEEDIESASEVIAADSAACLVVYENRWLAPLAVALRQSGAQLVASERLHVQGILAALDAIERNEQED
jgi:hypothetical protein